MKTTYTLLSAFLILFLLGNDSFAQSTPPPATVVVTGPSDATTIPATASDFNLGLCFGTSISLNGPALSTTVTGYQWYKLDASKKMQFTGVTTQKYTETTTDAGYYTYVLVTLNSTGCSSAGSTPFKVYVFPSISAAIPRHQAVYVQVHRLQMY
jgi:hypothetical protein